MSAAKLQARERRPNRLRKIKRSLALLVLLFGAGAARAEISLELQMDRLQTAEIDDSVPAGSLILLVADTAGDGFDAAISDQSGEGSGIIAEQGIALDGTEGNDLVLWRGSAQEPGMASAFIHGLRLGNHGGLSWSNETRLAVYWFPELTIEESYLPTGELYGRFSADSELSGGDPWETPPDGTSGHRLYALTTNAHSLRGPLEPSELLASEAVEDRPGTTYEEWIAGFPEITGSAQEPAADFSGDGAANLLKFGFGLDPRTASRDELPEMTRRSNGVPELAFRRRRGGVPEDAAVYVADHVRYLVEVSPNLRPGSWRSHDDAGEPLVELRGAAEAIDDGIEIVTVAPRDPPGDASRLFLRLRLDLMNN